MNILGISCYYHDSAACLVQDGRVVAAAHEERFNRRKTCADLPLNAVNFCLQRGGITLNEVDQVAFYEKPYLKLERVIIAHLRAWPHSLGTFLRTLPPWLESRLIVPLALRDELGWEGEVSFVKHHLAHAASAFLASPFDEAAILTVDGVGEWATTTLGRGGGNRIEIIHELRFPDSLGLVYTAVTAWLGFEALRGEGKVMALADYGEPRFVKDFHEMVEVRRDGSIRVDTRALGFLEGDRMVGAGFLARFGPPRLPGAEISSHHKDMAASLQAFLEEVLLAMACHLHAITHLDRLCIAGGVGLNISATSRIIAETPFQDLFIQPAAGDAGTALGAALAVHHALCPSDAPRSWCMADARLGPDFSPRVMRRALAARGLRFVELEEGELIARVAERIRDGAVVGWFQGRMEFGPRALGARSILADPRHPKMKEILNDRVKHRESFRPYGVSVLLDQMRDWFHFDRPSPFMLQVARVRQDKKALIPSAVHVNDTTRLHTVAPESDSLYHALISRFHEMTGVPMVINTSFNDNNEPIVCTPDDALGCFLRTGMDAMALGSFFVDKSLE